MATEAAAVQPTQRAAFEAWFADSRRSRGRNHRPTFERRDDSTYADDHTQRHWWTWQQAQAAERERCAKLCDAQSAEWDSDAVQTHKNYAACCATLIRGA